MSKHKHTWQLYEYKPCRVIEIGLGTAMVLPEVFKFVCECGVTKETTPREGDTR